MENQSPQLRLSVTRVLLIIGLLIIVGFVAWFFADQQSVFTTNTFKNSVDNANTLANTPVTNTALTGMRAYSNTTYGFALAYPESYEYYTGSNPGNGLLFNWGINNFQELLFSINVHPLSRKESMISSGELIILPETREIGGRTAHTVSRGGLYAIEANGYLYVIDSLYQAITNAPDKKADFFSILDSITFTQQR